LLYSLQRRKAQDIEALGLPNPVIIPEETTLSLLNLDYIKGFEAF
jgi:hypothetical protein